MKIYKFNDVFNHVEYTLREYYGNDPAYDKVLIILGYNVLPSLKKFREQYVGYKIIIYQLEQLRKDNVTWVNKRCYNILKTADEIWDYDEGNIKWMRKNYKLNAKLKPLVYTESLKILPPIDETNNDIDILIYGYLNERRARLIMSLHHKAATKYKIFDLYGIWGKDLDEYVSRSKIILNVHGHKESQQEQVRMYYPAINGRCVLSEDSPINYMGNSIVQVPYGDIMDKSLDMLKTGEWLGVAQNASENYQKISEKYKVLV